MRCLSSARFNMTADILRQGTQAVVESDLHEVGEYVPQQDPVSGEIIRVWQPGVSDDPTTPNDESIVTIPVEARGIVDGGIRVAGTTERFGADFSSVDFVRIRFPAEYTLTKRDRVTNIRDAAGNVAWLDEEVRPESGLYRATVFNVNGVTPLFNGPFNVLDKWEALLERVDFNG